MKLFYSILLVLVPAVLLGQVALWDFDGATTAPTSSAPNVTAANVQTGPGVVDPGNPFPGGNPGQAYAQENWSTGTYDADDYFEFTLSPDAGYKMDLSAFVFDEKGQGAGMAPIELRSSIDGLTSTIDDGFVNTNWTTHTFTLGAAFQNVTDPITFRLYGYDFNTSGADWMIDNVMLQGAVMLPVTLISFDGTYDGNSVTLTWQTGVEISNAHFVIQRRDNNAFEDIGITQGEGTTNTKQTYTFVDDSPLDAPISYYRLKQVDLDGKETLHKIIKVITIETNGSSILFRDLPREIDGNIMNMIGEEINPNQDLPEGIYFWKRSSGKIIRVWK